MKKTFTYLSFIFLSILFIACAGPEKPKENENVKMKIVTTTFNDTVYYNNGEMKIVSTTVTDTLYMNNTD